MPAPLELVLQLSHREVPANALPSAIVRLEE
jgi:hypothetical protein